MATNIYGMFTRKIKADATIAGCINIFENVWPDPAKTIRDVESQCADPESGVYWSRAETIGHGPNQNLRTNRLIPITQLSHVTDNIVLQDIHNQYYRLLISAILSYANQYNITENFFHENYNMLKYRPGEEYKFHYDSGTVMGRAISAILYLNSDYTGGEIEFPNFGVTIKPEPGMLILFPSNFAYAHIAKPVITGTKYAIVTWIKDRQL